MVTYCQSKTNGASAEPSAGRPSFPGITAGREPGFAAGEQGLQEYMNGRGNPVDWSVTRPVPAPLSPQRPANASRQPLPSRSAIGSAAALA